MTQLRNHMVAVITAAFVIGVGFGCGGDEPPPQPQVVSKKISTPAAPAPMAPAPAAPAPSAPALSTPASTPGGTQEMSSAPAAQESTADTNQTMAALSKQADSAIDTMFRPRLFRAEGQPDPFKPFYKKKEAARVETSSPKIKRRTPQTPLERMELGQVRLVGIMRLPEGNRAVVEEASGKGYIIKKGTYIGTQGGQVVSILRDRVIIEEQLENALGKIIIQKKQLKLQKPLGD